MQKIDGKEVVMFGMGAIKGAGDVAINSILKKQEMKVVHLVI